MNIKFISNLLSTISGVYIQTIIFLSLKQIYGNRLDVDFVSANALIMPVYMFSSMNLRMVYLVLDKGNANFINYQFLRLIVGLCILICSFILLDPKSLLLEVLIFVRFIDSLQELHVAYYIKNGLYRINILLSSAKLFLVTFLVIIDAKMKLNNIAQIYLWSTIVFYLLDFLFIRIYQDLKLFKINIKLMYRILRRNFIYSLTALISSATSNLPRYLLFSDGILLTTFHLFSILPTAFAYLASSIQDLFLLGYREKSKSARNKFIIFITTLICLHIFSFLFIVLLSTKFLEHPLYDPALLPIVILCLLFLLFKQVENLFLGILFVRLREKLILIYHVFFGFISFIFAPILHISPANGISIYIVVGLIVLIGVIKSERIWSSV